MRTNVNHVADENLRPTANYVHFTNLDTGHGQPVGQFLGRHVHVYVLFEPAKGYFHLLSSVFAGSGISLTLKVASHGLPVNIYN